MKICWTRSKNKKRIMKVEEGVAEEEFHEELSSSTTNPLISSNSRLNWTDLPMIAGYRSRVSTKWAD
jgi:hypothetical protein